MSNDEFFSTVNRAITLACSRQFGPLDKDFLCKSLSTIHPKNPRCVLEHTTTEEVHNILCKENIGCVLITDGEGRLVGIFTERDFLRRVPVLDRDALQLPVTSYMTPEPRAELLTITVAFALNLMSVGGFRHLPLVDESNTPVGIVSVKDIVDALVNQMNDSIGALSATVNAP